MADLVDAVAAELARRDLPLDGDRKRSTFRIHRDTRFSRDKRPYKTAVGSVWSRQGGGKSPGGGVLYFHLDPAGCFVGAAFYMPEPDALDSIREHIRVHPERWDRVLVALDGAGLPLEAAESLVRMPKGFEDLRDSPHAAHLRLKSFLVRRTLTRRQVMARTLPATVADLGEQALPLLQFGWAAIDEGRST